MAVRKAMSGPFMAEVDRMYQQGMTGAAVTAGAAGITGLTGLVDLFTGDQKGWNSGEVPANLAITAGVAGLGLGALQGAHYLGEHMNQTPEKRQALIRANPEVQYNPDNPKSTFRGGAKVAKANAGTARMMDDAAFHLIRGRNARNAGLVGAGAAGLAALTSMFTMMNDKPRTQEAPIVINMEGVQGGMS